eukprot:13419-Eustigmatos_ZCMA.PRE.1
MLLPCPTQILRRRRSQNVRPRQTSRPRPPARPTNLPNWACTATLISSCICRCAMRTKPRS